MKPDLFGDFETDSSLPVFRPERPAAGLAYCALRCRCGSAVFRLTGWPRAVSGRGGFFWRTLSRVWREARLPMRDGEPLESPFWLPVFASCEFCGRSTKLFDDESVVGGRPTGNRDDPKEAFRCRLCRRSLVELVAGVASDELIDHRLVVDLVSRCHGCRSQARVVWSEEACSEQELRLDLLYGRR